MKKTLVFALFCTLLYSQNIENNFLVSEKNASKAEFINEDNFATLSKNLESNTRQNDYTYSQMNNESNNVQVLSSEKNSNFKDNNQQNLQTTNINSQEPTAVVFPEHKQENYPITEDKQQNINQAQNQQNYQNIDNSAQNQQNAYPQNYNQGNANQSNSQNYNPQNSQNYQQKQASYNQGNTYQNNANPSQANNYNQQNQQYQQQVNPNYNQANNSQNYQNSQNNQNYQNPQNFNQAQQNYNQGNPQYQQQGNQQNYNQGAYNQQNQAYQQNYNQPNNQQNYQNAQNNPQYQNAYPQNYNQNQGNYNQGNAYQNNVNQAQQQYYNQQNQGSQQQYYPNPQELNQAQNYNQQNQAYQQNYNQSNNQQNYQNSQNFNQAQAVNVPEKAKSSFKITDIDLIAIAKFIVGAFLLGILFIVFKHGKRILSALIWPFKKIWKATKIVSEFSSFVAKKLIIEYPTRAFNAVIIEPAKAIGDFSVKAFNATKDGLSNLGSGFLNLFKGEGKARTNFQMDIVSMKSLGELNAYQIKNKMSVDHEAEAFQDFSTLSKIFSNKKMIIDFDFDLHFIYDLNDPNFKMEQIKDNEFNIKMPTCKYRYSVKNINIHSEESSKLKILPNLKFGLISKGFSHEEKNALVKEAMNKNEMDLIRKEIEATKANIQESAMKSITNLAKSFGNKNIKLNFEFNDTELLNADALEMEMIEDKKQSDKMSNVIEVEQLTKKEN